jgi:hypothetical protein
LSKRHGVSLASCSASSRRARFVSLADAVGEVVETLRAGLQAEDANTRIRSAVAILDRSWGRPRRAVEAAVTVTPTVITPEVDAAKVLQGLSELGLISRPGMSTGSTTPRY